MKTLKTKTLGILAAAAIATSIAGASSSASAAPASNAIAPITLKDSAKPGAANAGWVVYRVRRCYPVYRRYWNGYRYVRYYSHNHCYYRFVYRYF